MHRQSLGDGGCDILKTLLGVYLLPSNFATLIFYWKIRQRERSHSVYIQTALLAWGFDVYPRRGLATLLILVDRQCEGLMVG